MFQLKWMDGWILVYFALGLLGSHDVGCWGWAGVG